MRYISNSQGLKDWRKDNMPSHCPITGVSLNEGNSVVDHSHENGFIRGVLSSEGNAILGRYENAFKRLSGAAKGVGVNHLAHNMADYLTSAQTDIIHPVGFRQLWKRFQRKTVDEQIGILEGLRQIGKPVTTEQILALKNGKERTDLYKKLLRNDQDHTRNEGIEE